MEQITIGSKILLHLSRYEKIDSTQIYDLPWDLTQDGIATSVRISRAHASIELKKLRELDRVEEHQCQIRGSRSCKRKAFFLTPIGKNTANELKNHLKDEGVDFESLLDLKKCDPEVLIDSLEPDAKEALGIASVLRVPIHRNDLPPTRLPVVPFDPVNGYITLADVVKENYLKNAEPEKIKDWHSKAADYWLEQNKEDQELLYHYVHAGRRIEACKLLLRKKDDFWANTNDDLNEIVSKLIDVPQKYAKEIYPISVEIALDVLDTEVAEQKISLLREYDSEKADMFLVDLEIQKENYEKALEIAESLEQSSPQNKLRLAKALFALNRFEESEKILKETESLIISEGKTDGLHQVLIRKAEIKYRNGDIDDAVKLLSKSRIHAPRREQERIDLLLDGISKGKDPEGFC